MSGKNEKPDIREKIIQARPFLFKYAKKCLSPGRAAPNPDYYFDVLEDIVRWKGDRNNTPAIDLEGVSGPDTKKCDIEKGDDMKDRRMWR